MEDVFATDGRPFDDGTENQTRGEGGEVRIIQYQAASILSPHVSTGYKDYDAARLVFELLPITCQTPSSMACCSMRFLHCKMACWPKTAFRSPSPQGRPLWSDGEPVTAEDIKFTVEWVLNPITPPPPEAHTRSSNPLKWWMNSVHW